MSRGSNLSCGRPTLATSDVEEQRECWRWIQSTIKAAKERSGNQPKVLNLFAYSGDLVGQTQAGAAVCHLDASKGMVAWARENAASIHLEQAPESVDCR